MLKSVTQFQDFSLFLEYYSMFITQLIQGVLGIYEKFRGNEKQKQIENSKRKNNNNLKKRLQN